MASPTPIFKNVARASWALVSLVVAVHLGLKLGFFSPLFLDVMADPIYDITRGYVFHSTTAGLITLIVVITLLRALGRLRACDLGLEVSKLPNGIVVTVFVWSIAQALLVLVGYVDGGTLYFGKPWAVGTPLLMSGFAQSIGVSAFTEELIFRGFLIPQVFLLLFSLHRWTWSKCLGLSVVFTQLYFSLSHLPAAIRMDLAWADALMYLSHVFVVGLLFAAIYLRTDNLYVAIGVHGLINFSAPLFEARVDGSLVILILACMLLLVWPYLTRFMDNVFTLEPGMNAWPVTERISRAQ